MASVIQPITPPVQNHRSLSCIEIIAELIIAVWKAFVCVVVTAANYIAHSISGGYSLAQKKAFQHLDERMAGSQSFIEKNYLQELKNQVKELSSGADPSQLFKLIDSAADEMEALSDFADEQVKNLIEKELNEQLFKEADALYRSCMTRLADLKKRPGTRVQQALYTGRLTTIFRKLDDAFSDKAGSTLHRYCGCHIHSKEKEDLKPHSPTIRDDQTLVDHPEKQSRGKMPEHASAVLLSQSYGGGHNVVQDAMSQRIAAKGGHAYKVKADEEILEAYYEYRKWTGKSGAEWSKFLLQNNCFRTIRFLGWLSNGRDSQETREEKINYFALSMLARGEQDAAVMCWGRNTSPAEKAASRLGMGLYEVATDLDYQVFDFKKDVENPHFRHGLMARDPQRQKAVLDKVLEPHHVVETGFPVRNAFLKEYTEEELKQLRDAYRQKYNLARDARVVLLLYGGEGVTNTMAETLAKEYPENGPKIHLFAICGKNEVKKRELETAFAQLNKPNLQATILGWTKEKELGELFAMGALEKDKGLLISAKAGGGTISEAIARGIPTLASDMGGIPHEQANLDFLVTKKLGKTFSKESELTQKAVEMLTTPFAPDLSPDGEAYSKFRSQEKSMQLVQHIVEASRKDPQFQQKRLELGMRLPRAFIPKPMSAEQISRYRKLWNKFKFDAVISFDDIHASHPDFTTFLQESKLLYALRGYQHSFRIANNKELDVEPFKLGFKIEKGHPLLYKEGQWIRWDEIKKQLFFDPIRKCIVNKRDEQRWIYTHPNGLAPATGQPQPIFKLTPDEMEKLKQFSAADDQKSCYLQVFTTEDTPPLNRLGHVGVRIIDQNGNFRSICTYDEEGKIARAGAGSLLSTYNIGLAQPDYSEFAKYTTRRVTTLPITPETFDKILGKVNRYAQAPLRFNFLRQNCATFAADILKEAGVKLNHTSSIIYLLWELIKDIPVLGLLARTVDSIARNALKILDAITPQFIQAGLFFTGRVIFWVPNKILNVLRNILLLVPFGATKEASPVKPGAENTLDNQERLTSFSRLISCVKDLFRDDLGVVHSSLEIVKWQMEEQSKLTYMHAYTGSPRFAIVPPTIPDTPAPVAAAGGA